MEGTHGHWTADQRGTDSVNLYTEIDDLVVLDPGLADRAEKLHCAATLSGLCHLSLKVTP